MGWPSHPAARAGVGGNLDRLDLWLCLLIAAGDCDLSLGNKNPRPQTTRKNAAKVATQSKVLLSRGIIKAVCPVCDQIGIRKGPRIIARSENCRFHDRSFGWVLGEGGD